MTISPDAIITYVADIITPSVLVNPLEFAYFTQLTPEQWNNAKHLASKVIQDNQNTVYRTYLNNHATIEKAGEALMGIYLEYYHEGCCSGNQECGPLECMYTLNGKSLSIHTRMLRTLDNITADGLRINTRKFFPMIPEIGLKRNADIYVFCGFDVTNRDGFIFGWSTKEEVDAAHIDYDLQVPAKCMPIPNLRPLTSLS